MAIKNEKQGELDGTWTHKISISNGQATALDEIVQRFKFKDVESFLSYALAVFAKGDSAEIVIKEDGKSIVISPADELLKLEEPGEQHGKS